MSTTVNVTNILNRLKEGAVEVEPSMQTSSSSQKEEEFKNGDGNKTEQNDLGRLERHWRKITVIGCTGHVDVLLKTILSNETEAMKNKKKSNQQEVGTNCKQTDER